MSTLADRLEQAMKGPPEKKPVDLARACGVRAPSVSDWMNGKTKKLEGANLLLAAKELNVDPWWLATGEGAMHRGADAPNPLQRIALRREAEALITAIEQEDKKGLNPAVFKAMSDLLQAMAEGGRSNDVIGGGHVHSQ